MSAIVKLEGLSHKYGSAWAIRDINLEINRPGVVGLLGANGAGKSTTMNILCGVLKQTEGRVYIQGIDTRKEPEQARKHIGFLPQHPPLYLDFTVDEYLTYTAQLRRIEKTEIKKAVSEAKERCGVAHFSNRLIRNLSGGYRQRVGIAQAIIHKPKLVVMDEPTNGLDPNQLIEARKLIREIGKDHTVLLSSHILSEIHLLCREVVMLEGGRIIFSDSMDAFNNYVRPHSLLLRLEKAPAPADLLKISGVTKVDFLNSKQVRVYFDGDEEIAERLAEASTYGGWQLREISLDKSLLDDIFKQLSNQIPA
ncbi:ABC-2 type transport system ATP-binding protein [Chitinophaga terrae (ex Kim and Jung 2007)]|uniref:ABC-2 type transport system ATP-binding protein n=1 Tax=Chitinophaga terrae (ex Kim and Jung 2007) TaxID=408074 RepID=A0A1H3WRR9_9BACT|nr:ABC transporter ATP-binding protein [Chitinophaga terrae (ex Kim and Jung 2007)]MDQ0109817.1 ABC-2 type transport system ATP-binding protein [Chitinophaga terrae (ex Kim and Jung 2007)]GEP90801.1 multidrug ABC transporter ATP-binding protein [Chitinophaga terrae (ex Kim and Jung 2007)]SDZ89856.1 ABC-2 type transport system ATP-binding protein [Chitinophaga terrae (ex Kim and Jung 2007)]